MKFLSRKRRHPPAIIIVSLIDILVVLLIFLMVTTTLKSQPSIQLALPESRHGQEGASENAPVIITVSKEPPFLYLGERPVTTEKLETELKARAASNSNLVISIRADTEAPFGKIIAVMDAARAANVRVANAYTRTPGK